MALSDIVNVIITSNSRGVSRASFGVPMVVAYHTNWYDTYKLYSLGSYAADMVSDGFTTYDPAYRAVAALARNTPKVKNAIVGRLTTTFTQQFTLTVQTAATEEGKVITFTVVSPNGTETDISYTVLAAATTTTVATAVAALINAITNLTSASAVAVITTDADNTGEHFYVKDYDNSLLWFEDTTADSNLAAEVAAINAAYPNTYGLILADCESKARVTALAAGTETQERIFGYTTAETAVGDPSSTTDVFYALKAALYFRTYGIYSESQGTYAAATWMGNRFPINPGNSTWAYKPLSGVTVDVLTSAFVAAIEGKNGNYYTEDGGLATTKTGKMAAGEWIDTIRGRDWLTARLRERIFGRLANSPKVPFTQPGAESIGADVDAQLKEGIAEQYLAADPEPIVTVPDVTDTSQVSAANKIARTLPGVSFEATLAGAIHIVDPLNGVISV
jgi:hypothetical protein